MKILLVQPEYPTSPFPGPNLPVGLGYLSEQLDLRQIEHSIHDVYVDSEEALFSRVTVCRPEYIGFSLMSLDIHHNYALISRLKSANPSVKLVVGGPHVSYARERVFDECPSIDYAILNEGETSLVELLEGHDSRTIRGLVFRDDVGRLVATAPRRLIQDLDNVPFPRYRRLDLSKYGNSMSIVSSRGCPFRCTFCGAHVSMGRQWRARSARNVISEILFWVNRGYSAFNFVDSNFFHSKKRTIEVCQGLDENRLDSIVLSSDGIRARDADFESLAYLKRFGLRSVAVGFESASDDVLTLCRKRESVADFERSLQVFTRLGIDVVGFFIIGLPGDTAAGVLSSFDFVLRYPIMSEVYFFNLNPLPGTDVYNWAVQNDFLIGNEESILRNIGGMSNRAVVDTPEFPSFERDYMLSCAHEVRRLVRTHHSIVYEACGPIHKALRKIRFLVRRAVAGYRIRRGLATMRRSRLP